MDRIEPKDYLKLVRVSDVQVTNNYVAWVELHPKPTDRGYTSNIKVLEKQKGSIKQFTSGSKRDTYPRFSPDGSKLAFLSTRDGKNQIYLMSMSGGEALQLTKNEKGVQGFEWSPDSSKILYVASSPVEMNESSGEITTPYDLEREELKKKEEKETKADPRILNDITYRRGTSYDEPDCFDHVFVIDIKTKESQRIADGEFNYSLPQFISANEFVVTSVREKPFDQQNEASLLKYNIDGNTEGEELFQFKSEARPSNPIASPSGLIFVNTFGEGNYAGQNNKYGLYKNGTLSLINEDLDRSIAQLRILSNDVLVSIESGGKTDIRVYNENSGEFSILVDVPTSIVDFDAVDTSEVYFTATDPKHVWAIYKWTSDGGLELIEDPNAGLFANKQIIEPEEFWLTNPEGLKYQGWFFDVGEVNGEKPPLVLNIHGGPQVMWTNAGTMWHEWQCLLAAGYSVLAVNPIGSSGFGQNFAQEIVPAKWGINDSRDLLAAVDHFLDRVNPDKLYITGGSYGGFQTANIITRDHRFKAAYAQRGVYNLVNFGLATDIPLWWRNQMGGTPWEKLQELWDISPLGRVEHVQTPLMMVHSENDFRVQISQAEDFYGALKLLGKDVVFIRYPRDGHELSRSGEPLHVVDRLERMLQWFDEHQ